MLVQKPSEWMRVRFYILARAFFFFFVFTVKSDKGYFDNCQQWLKLKPKNVTLIIQTKKLSLLQIFFFYVSQRIYSSSDQSLYKQPQTVILEVKRVFVT